MTNFIRPPTGKYEVFVVDERSGKWTKLFCRFNQIQYDWAKIACQTIGFGKSNYKINAMYIEYENVVSPGDIVTVPNFDRDEGREYYENLSGSRDYLRVPLVSQPQLSVGSGYELYFSGNGEDNNTVTFFAQTSGSSGIHGVPFSSSNNSKVCGIALVATPEWRDISKDIIFGRAYFDLAEQILKDDAYQIGVSWSQTFG